MGMPSLLSAQCLLRSGATVIVSFLFTQTMFAADFTVTSPGFFYAINGNQPNPTITLVRGQTYTFAVNSSSIHPFLINSPGVLNNNISQGTITTPFQPSLRTTTISAPSMVSAPRYLP